MSRKRRAGRLISACLALVVASTVVIASPAEARRITSEDLAQELDWQSCYEELSAQTGAVFECATVLVPLDYDRNSRQRDLIEIALVRIPAGEPANREGAILLNPGGPGGSGIDFLLGFGPFAGFVLGPDVPARFDLVGFDPRGVQRSTPIRCFNTVEEAEQVFPPVAFPLTRAEERLFQQADRALARACRTFPGARRIGEHISTANVARDMDVIRSSMGDESLNFLGLSYGTFVAASYANLFPDRVRAVVADGVLDPEAWVNREGRIPFSTRLRSDEGAAETLEEFFTQCEAAAPGNCAFTPNPRERFDSLAAALLEGPIELTDPETGEQFQITYQDLIGFMLGNLYNPFVYALVAEVLILLESAVLNTAPAPSPAALATFNTEPYDNFVESFVAIACADTNGPRSYRAYSRAGAAADAEFGYFGRIWTWLSSPCIQWPFRDRDRYQGPFTAETANPVLVIGNLYDPATRYEGAQALRSLLPNSGLLTVDVPGHTSLGLSVCAGVITGQYFLDPSVATAVDGDICAQEFNAFDLFAGGSAAAAQAAAVTAPSDSDMTQMVEIRAQIMTDMGLYPPAITP